MRWSYDEQKHIKISHTDISGTKLSGAVKRKYMDMKYEINKLILITKLNFKIMSKEKDKTNQPAELQITTIGDLQVTTRIKV